VEHFVGALSREAKRSPVTVAHDTWPWLQRYPWPGNIRELRNAIERAVVLCADEITPGDLPPEVLAHGQTEGGQAEGFHARVEVYRKQLIRAALLRTGGNRTKAAAELGLQRTYLARLIRNYGLGGAEE
jgi:two-component system nitrogen regulation response regulator NtrX